MAVNFEALLQKIQLSHPNEVEDKTCPLCLDDYLQGPSRELPRKLPCGHLIGTECFSIWASSQTRISSTKCPWCRQRINNLVRRKKPRRAVERELVERASRLIDLASFLALPVVYFGNWLAWLPLEFLYVYTSIAIKRRLTSHPRLGMIQLVLGLCVGMFFNNNLGKALMKYGKAPFEPAIRRVFKDHMWAVLSLALVMILAGIVVGELTGETHGYDFSTGAVLQKCLNSWLELDFDVGW